MYFHNLIVRQKNWKIKCGVSMGFVLCQIKHTESSTLQQQIMAKDGGPFLRFKPRQSQLNYMSVCCSTLVFSLHYHCINDIKLALLARKKYKHMVTLSWHWYSMQRGNTYMQTYIQYVRTHTHTYRSKHTYCAVSNFLANVYWLTQSNGLTMVTADEVLCLKMLDKQNELL